MITIMVINDDLVGGWPTPLKNMTSSVGSISRKIWKHKKCSKPPTRREWMDNIIATKMNRPADLGF